MNWKNIIRSILLALCGAALGINIYLTNANRLVGNQLPMPFGYGAAVVLSGSMEPELSRGDLIVVGEADRFQEGDIIVFQDGNALVVHRIIAIDGDEITTQGDANNAADDPIHIADIKGKVLFWIPFLGNVIDFIKTPVGTLCLIALAILLVELPRRNEKKKDDEDRQKIIDEIKRLKEQN